MRVLILFEFSGVVRDAFRDLGHEAWSNDLLPSLTRGPHLQGDYRQFTGPCQANNYKQWDLVIAHPPCIYLTNAGVRWLYGGAGTVRDPLRWREMEKAAHRFSRLYAIRCSRLAIENPIMHSHAAAIVGRRPTQTIQPWQFGHGEIKRTCLWLRNLPLLEPTRIVSGRRPRVHHESPGVINGLTRSQRRSITYQGIAEAMADQWGSLSI